MISNEKPTLPELLATALAKTFRDEEVGFTGLVTGNAAALFATAIPVAAMQLARLTHAPGLTILLAGWSHNPDLSQLDEIPDSEFDAVLRDLPCEAQQVDYPGQYSLKRGDVSFGFSSGAQIDITGSLNSVCIGDYHRPKVRLVGPILQPEHMTLFGREYIMMPRHDARTFIEKVDYVSGVGYPGGLKGRRDLGLEKGGPELVMTPKCVFEFDKIAGSMIIRSIHPGVSAEELRRSTGFDLGDLTNVALTDSPDREELRLLREVIDPKGLLLRGPGSETFV
ncbi:CoA-transferase [Phyllobacterium sp. SB3]|uniref:CoA-transferase n=1 Tax=Phyllobacterium sp. SB3 TaxID=3156073 RepID=UPI0032AF2B83